MATEEKALPFHSYTFHAKALAAHFHFTTDSDDDFGPEFALAFHGRGPVKHKEKGDGRLRGEYQFKRSWVHVSTRELRGGVYVTVAKSGLRGLNIKGKVTADEIEAGIMAVYRKEWFADPRRPRRPRILPLPPVFDDLRICGKPYRLDKELRLPEAFRFSEARRKEYFAGEGPEIEPVAISDVPVRREPCDGVEMEISSDTRRIEIPKFGIVTFADWTWVPPNIHIAPHTVQRVQLIGLDLKNPGSGGGGGASGGGTPYGKGPTG